MTFFSRLFGSNDRESLGSDAGSFRRAEGAAARLEQRIANVEMALAETQDKVYRWMKRHQERQSVNGEDKGAVQNHGWGNPNDEWRMTKE